MQQALNTVKLSTCDQHLQRQILVKVGGMLGSFPHRSAPPVNAAHYYRLIAAMTGNDDPYAAIKKQSNEYALSLESAAAEAIERAGDPLLSALQFAIGANVLDNGAQKQLDVEATLARCQQQPFAINHYPQLRKRLIPGKKVLLLADNCGEIVFDKLLVLQLSAIGCEVTVAVRGMPTINDATVADAAFCGMNAHCRVIDNGADIPGTSLAHCSPQFLEYFRGADWILSKGMGNFECLSQASAPVTFLFTVKCSTVLRHLQSAYPEASLEVGSAVVVDGPVHG